MMSDPLPAFSTGDVRLIAMDDQSGSLAKVADEFSGGDVDSTIHGEC
jgi:hypothetical protein